MTDQKSDERTLRKELHWLERIYYASQLFLALIGIAALVVYHEQLTTMQDSLSELRGSSTQTDKLLSLNSSQLAQITKQAQGTQQLAVQAELQAKATQAALVVGRRQADITQEAAFHTEADKRPWVTVTPEDLPPLPKEPNGSGYSFALLLKNYGDTPASDVRIACTVFSGKASIGPEIDPLVRSYVQNNLHFPKSPAAGTLPPALTDFATQAPLAPSQEAKTTLPWPTDRFPISLSYLVKIKEVHGAYYVQCKVLYAGTYGVQGETDSLWFVSNADEQWSLTTEEIGNYIH